MRVLLLVAVCVCVSAVEVELEAEPSRLELEPFFAAAAQSVPQILIQQEFQRGLGDFYRNIHEASYFQMMAMYQLMSSQAAKKQQDDGGIGGYVDTSPFTSDGTSLFTSDSDGIFDSDSDVGVDSFSNAFDSDSDSDGLFDSDSDATDSFLQLEMFPMGTDPSKQSPEELFAQSTMFKLFALKYNHVELVSIAADIEKAYWMNRLLSAVLPPQMVYIKLYRNYLSTIVLSLGFQFQDAFTLEAYQENFNNRFSAGSSSLVAETVSEYNVYSKLLMIGMIRMQLEYLSFYDQANPAVSQMQGQAFGATSFMELAEQLKAEPSKPQDPASMMMMQIYYLRYYRLMLTFYEIYAEIHLGQMGSTAAMQHLHSYSSDEPVSSEIQEHMDHIELTFLPMMWFQWSNILRTKSYLDYYMLMMSMYMPAMIPQSAAGRASDAAMNMNFFQSEEPTLTPPQQ